MSGQPELRSLDALARGPIAAARGNSLPMGATLVPRGVNFSLFSRHATGVTLALFAPEETAPAMEVRLDPQVHRTGDVWHVEMQGLGAGLEYGYRVAGPHGPGHAFDPDRVLFDPYSRALSHGTQWGVAGRPRRSLVVDTDFDWGLDTPLNIPVADTVIYELHVRGFTRGAGADVTVPGTYAGLIDKIPYLQRLGVTAVELMPVTEFDELERPAARNPLTGEPLFNFWGYDPIALFAPKASYAADRAPGGAIREFKQLVKAMHQAGIEVILDLVFNHTGEGGLNGPTSSFRGIDNLTYYITDPVTGRYRDYTGCGNTLNCNHPVVRDLILDCLRYWVTEMHVDGFRFDLASVLGRGRDGAVLPEPPVLERIAADPILARTKLIAEAWDAAGLYQVGSFPAWGRWAEWNGRFRDDVRRFVRGENNLAGPLATRLSGSPDLYRGDGRNAHHSINFVTSHDGFTLADLVSFNAKHNEGNGEGSRDGSDANDSWNCGWEGPGAPADVDALRQRQVRNFLTLLVIAQGVPMLLAGDECGRTQGGNNNAYCQDSPVSWMPWAATHRNERLFAFTTRLMALRGRYPQLRHANFLDHADDGTARVEWHGSTPARPDWSAGSRLLVMRLAGEGAAGDLLIVINGDQTAALVTPPDAGVRAGWRMVVDTGTYDEPPIRPVAGPFDVPARTVWVLAGPGREAS